MPSAIQLKRGRDLDVTGTRDTLIADTDGIYHRPCSTTGCCSA
jgi:hypothetical protein